MKISSPPWKYSGAGRCWNEWYCWPRSWQSYGGCGDCSRRAARWSGPDRRWLGAVTGCWPAAAGWSVDDQDDQVIRMIRWLGWSKISEWLGRSKHDRQWSGALTGCWPAAARWSVDDQVMIRMIMMIRMIRMIWALPPMIRCRKSILAGCNRQVRAAFNVYWEIWHVSAAL